MQPIAKNAKTEDDTLSTTTVVCPTCQGELIRRTGRYGDFYGCSNYPSCRQSAISLQNYALMERSLKRENSGPKKEFKPTPEQQEIFDWVIARSNNTYPPNMVQALLVEACAGSGKTTTIGQAINLLKSKNIRDIVYLVFATKNREEAQAKGLPAMTTHQHGFSAIRAYLSSMNLGKAQVDGNKTADIAVDLIGRRMETMKWMIGPTIKIIGLLKNNLAEPLPEIIEDLILEYGIDLHPEANLGQLSDFVRQVWDISVNKWSVIDFDDMIFLPVYHNLNVKRYRYVFADEVQDFNPCQIELLKRTVTFFLMAVGDRNQSIFAFRGAAIRAMDDILMEFNAEEKSLSVSFRVPKVGVEYVNDNFSHIKFVAWEHAKEGRIWSIPEEKLSAEVKDKDLVLCRMNAPLVKYVFELLRQGRKATIIGRDLASQLSAMVERFCDRQSPHNVETITLLEKLRQYRYLEVEKLTRMGREMAAEILADKVETIIAISDGCANAQCILDRIDRIFSKDQGEGVAFSTVHKAKGMEAVRVFILRSELMPLQVAMGNPVQEVQEMNIEYVAVTRFMSEMCFTF